MAKSRDKNETEHLKGELREANKVIKALKKRLRQLEKSRHIWNQNNLDADEREAPPPVDLTVRCPSCANGTVLSIDLGIRTLHSCSSCLWRKTEMK